MYSRPRQTASQEHGLTRWPSRRFEAVEEQTDVVMGKKRGVSMWTLGWGFFTRAVSSKAKVWAVTREVELATSSSPTAFSREPGKQTGFCLWTLFESKLKLKVLYVHFTFNTLIQPSSIRVLL